MLVGREFARSSGRGRRAAVRTTETNGTIAPLPRDLASVQTSQHGRWGYNTGHSEIVERQVAAGGRVFRDRDRVVNCWPLEGLLEWAVVAWERSG
jgi:hypothetical protein